MNTTVTSTFNRPLSVLNGLLFLVWSVAMVSWVTIESLRYDGLEVDQRQQQQNKAAGVITRAQDSHRAVQDYALTRSFPQSADRRPWDPVEVRACMRYLTANPQPSYLPLGKADEPNFHAAVPDVVPGYLAGSGGERQRPLRRAEVPVVHRRCTRYHHALAQRCRYKNHCVRSLPLWSMASKAAQIDAIKRFHTVDTLEDHLVDGGFGSGLMESVVGHSHTTEFRIHALSAAVCGTVSTQNTLNALGGLGDMPPASEG